MMLSGVEDRLSLLVDNARELVDCGFYSERAAGLPDAPRGKRASLVGTIKDRPDFPIIAEVKLASPTAGRLGAHVAEELVEDYRQGGAAAMSVLTEPRYFMGSLRYMIVAIRTGVPVMMKDFVIDRRQLDVAARLGASAVLMIEGIFDRELAPGRDDLIAYAHALGLEVVLESSSIEELEKALNSAADVIAYNQRDLRTFRPGPDDVRSVMEIIRSDGRPSMIMSMMDGQDDVRKMRDLGASCVLVGSALSRSPCPKDKLISMRMPR